MKCNLTRHGTGVFLMLRGPGGFTGGQTSEALVSQIDLFPTVCDLVDVPHPDWLQGRSMLPLIRGAARGIRDETFSEVNFHVSYEPARSIRTKRWNYVRRFGDRRLPSLANCDDSPSKDEWLEHGWGRRIQDAECLFDLEFDPNETRNVAPDATLRPVLDDLRQR